MASSCNPTPEKFSEAAQTWDLERLYADLASAKKIWTPHARKGLSNTEKEYLRGLLCGYNPDRIAEKLHKNAGGVRSALTNTIYRYVETLTTRPPNSLNSWQDVADWLAAKYKITPSHPTSRQKTDWNGATDICNFYGRHEELTNLEKWTTRDNCRLIGIFGMGGIGKTTLAVRAAKQLQPQFEYVIWRSLYNAPPIEQLLTDLIYFLSDQQETNLPITAASGIDRVMEYLRSHHCLLILDECEAIFATGEVAGLYAEGYEEYRQLIKRIAKETHKSCLILTSRESPKEMDLLTQNSFFVETLSLKGLTETEAGKFLSNNQLNDSERWGELIELYRGNPLALLMISCRIKSIFNGSVAQFLDRNTILLDENLEGILEQQVERLPLLEKEILYWLAIERKPISSAKLRNKMLSPMNESELLKALNSLDNRSLLEKKVEEQTTLFTLQPTLMRYIIKRIVEEIGHEIRSTISKQTTDNLEILRNLAIITEENQASEVYRMQSRLIVTPIRDRLIAFFRSDHKLVTHLNEILSKLAEKSPLEVGYAVANVQSLLNTLPKLDS